MPFASKISGGSGVVEAGIEIPYDDFLATSTGYLFSETRVDLLSCLCQYTPQA